MTVSVDVVSRQLLQVRDLMRVLKRPFEEQPGAEKYRVAAPKEVRMGVELLSCSS